MALNLQATGMEFASEMVVKAALAGQHVTEVPTTLAKDGRSRPPHLHTWRDGWRHLQFLLSYSPRWLFIYPGLFLMGVGIFSMFFFFFLTLTKLTMSLELTGLIFSAICILL